MFRHAPAARRPAHGVSRQRPGGADRPGGRPPAPTAPASPASGHGIRLPAWNSDTSATAGSRSPRSPTATGSPTARRSRTTTADAVRAGRARQRHLHVRHRRRLRQHQGGGGARRGAEGRATRVARDLHEGLLAHRPRRQERHRPVPQAHHGVDQRLAAAAADRLRRPLPGPPLRHRDPARGDDAGVRRHRPPGQGALHRRQRVDRRPDPRRASSCSKELGFQLISSQPQYSMLWRVIEDEVVPDLARARRLPDRLVPGGPGRAHRQVQAGRAAPGRLARHGREGRRGHDQALHERRRPHPRAGPHSPSRRSSTCPSPSSRSRGCCRTTTSPPR